MACAAMQAGAVVLARGPAQLTAARRTAAALRSASTRASRPAAARSALLVSAAASRPSSAGAAADEEGTGRDFASSLSLLILGAALLSERLNGGGLVAQMELDHPSIEPLLLGISGWLAAAAVWPAKRRGTLFADLVRDAAGRAAFAGLAAAIAAEVYTGQGLLALLGVGTGAEVLSEMEGGLAVLLLLVLTKPKKA